jgi:hypothetical protein
MHVVVMMEYTLRSYLVKSIYNIAQGKGKIYIPE